MVYAVISDVHGNLPALEAVLADARRMGAGQFLLVGDYITDLCWSRQVYEVLRDLDNAHLVAGNREGYMRQVDLSQRGREQVASVILTWEQLGKDGCAWALALPHSLTLSTPDGNQRLYLEHCLPGRHHVQRSVGLASHTLDERYPNRPAKKEEVRAMLRDCIQRDPAWTETARSAGARVFLHGHNHLQYSLELDGVLYVNPGSCGMPLDHRPGAPYTLLRYEDGVFSVEERRVAYDLERTVEEYRNSPYYQAAPGWCQMLIWQLQTARDHNRVLFQMLQEEQERCSPQTDSQHNQVFRRAVERTKEWYYPSR
ncbi:MAG: metallophosphoesterase family protein [Acutalibacter sp.]|jgi:predicted phosphodiesterase